MEIGSWRDAAVGRDLLLLAISVVVAVFAAVLPIGLVGLLLLPLVVGTLVAILLRLRGGPGRSVGTPDVPHRGPNVSHIYLAGFPGGAFVVGFVWMFWFGAPAMRPVVVLSGVLGVLGGVALVLVGRRHRVRTSNPLGLHEAAGSGRTGAAGDGRE